MGFVLGYWASVDVSVGRQSLIRQNPFCWSRRSLAHREWEHTVLSPRLPRDAAKPPDSTPWLNDPPLSLHRYVVRGLCLQR